MSICAWDAANWALFESRSPNTVAVADRVLLRWNTLLSADLERLVIRSIEGLLVAEVPFSPSAGEVMLNLPPHLSKLPVSGNSIALIASFEGANDFHVEQPLTVALDYPAKDEAIAALPDLARETSQLAGFLQRHMDIDSRSRPDAS